METTSASLRYDISAHFPLDTFEYHCGMHQLTYVIKLNNLNKGTAYERLSLDTIIKSAPAGKIHDAAAQVWNHTFFWNSMEPNGSRIPSGALADAINEKWNSLEGFKKAFQASAVANTATSWIWLLKKADGTLDIRNMDAASSPLTTMDKPLLCVDVRAHSYYVEYHNKRLKFVEAFLNKLANWNFAAKNFS